jgi:integrase
MAKSQLVKFKDKKGNTYPYLYIDQMTGTFYAVKRIGKDVKKKPLGKEFLKARSAVITAIQELASAKPLANGVRLVKDYYEIMIEQKKSIDTKEITLKRIEGIWRLSISPYWAFLTPEEINQDQITNFITWHRRNRPGIQFINVFKYLGNLLNIMVERGDLPVSQKPKLTIPKEEQKQHDKQKGRYITDDEFKKIIHYADSTTSLALKIAYCTGMRKMEILKIHKSMIELQADRYVVKLDTDDTKTGLARVIPLPAFLTATIKDRLTGAKFLFPMKLNSNRSMSGQLLDKGWASAKSLAKISGKMRFHDLRHTAASNLAKDGINPVISVTMLGMSLVTFQKTYLKLQTSDIIVAAESNAARLGLAK